MTRKRKAFMESRLLVSGDVDWLSTYLYFDSFVTSSSALEYFDKLKSAIPDLEGNPKVNPNLRSAAKFIQKALIEVVDVPKDYLAQRYSESGLDKSIGILEKAINHRGNGEIIPTIPVEQRTLDNTVAAIVSYTEANNLYECEFIQNNTDDIVKPINLDLTNFCEILGQEIGHEIVALIEWHRTLPGVNSEISIDQIIDFKDKYSDELLKFRYEMDDLEISLCRAKPNELKGLVRHHTDKIEIEMGNIERALTGRKMAAKGGMFGALCKLSKGFLTLSVNKLKGMVDIGDACFALTGIVSKIRIPDDDVVKSNPFGYVYRLRDDGIVGNYKKINDICS